MSYEVILSQAVTDRPASPPSSSPPSQRNSLTHEQINSKLEQAEQRRKVGARVPNFAINAYSFYLLVKFKFLVVTLMYSSKWLLKEHY